LVAVGVDEEAATAALFPAMSFACDGDADRDVVKDAIRSPLPPALNEASLVSMFAVRAARVASCTACAATRSAAPPVSGSAAGGTLDATNLEACGDA